MGTEGSTVLEPLRLGLPPIDPAAATSSASCSLPARFEAVGGARQFTGTALQQWDLADQFDAIAKGSPTDQNVAPDPSAVPDALTLDDLE